MENALVIGGSGGIGAAVCAALMDKNVSVTSFSRRENGFDMRQPEVIEAQLSDLKGPFDLIFVATGILAPRDGMSEKSLRQVSASEMSDMMAVNCIGPALVMRHLPRLMDRKRPSTFAALSARVGSISDNRLGGWYS